MGHSYSLSVWSVCGFLECFICSNVLSAADVLSHYTSGYFPWEKHLTLYFIIQQYLYYSGRQKPFCIIVWNIQRFHHTQGPALFKILVSEWDLKNLIFIHTFDISIAGKLIPPGPFCVCICLRFYTVKLRERGFSSRSFKI